MNLPARRSLRGPAVAALAVLALLSTACAPEDDNAGDETTPTETPSGDATSGTEATDPCDIAGLPLKNASTLTVGTSDPAFPPWVIGNDPTNGKGFESAVAYAIAEQMGFTDDQVQWVKVGFAQAFAPSAKDFDFDLNQISITPKRAEAVDFSEGYYDVAQAIITLKDSAFADATLDDLKDAKIGAQIGTTSQTEAEEVIQPNTEVAVFDDTNGAKQALLNGTIDAIVADLDTALYITAVEIPQGTIVGQFPTSSDPEQFGLVFEKGSGLVDCVNTAITALKDDGTLADLESKWLDESADIPVLE